MNDVSSSYWLEHCAKPRARPQGIDWDVFISYRSADRIWALALYDMLVQARYKIFLDQFVLAAGGGLLPQLSTNMSRSASGVIVWSKRAVDSEWVGREVGAMVARRDASLKSSFPFHFVAATLDSEPLPALLLGSLYLDFSTYPDGPSGGELVRLTSGLQGTGLEPKAVLRLAEQEDEVRQVPIRLRAMVAAGQFDAIRDDALGDTVPYTTSATLSALAAQLLISGKRYDDAFRVIERARDRFRRSVRLRQLRGLALRRSGKTDEALLELEMLRADGHQDPETLGILGAAWTDRWKASANRDDLERARDLYRLAFERTPTDTYSGINAASKSALLREFDVARDLAKKVLERLAVETASRGGAPSDDYWERVTEPEALFLLGEFEKSLKLYHDARIAHSTEIGSIESTASQLALLLSLEIASEPWTGRFRDEFKAFIK